MLPHLHVHLEPHRRLGRVAAVPLRAPASQRAFFLEHSGLPEITDRYLSLTSLRRLIREICEEQTGEGVDYVEIRLSPRRWLRAGVAITEFLVAADESLGEVNRQGKIAPRGVLLLNRDSQPEYTSSVIEAFEQVLPENFVGIDLAGDETRFSDVSHFASYFEHFGDRFGLDRMVHAGEQGSARQVWIALDVLGANRIAHPLGAAEDSCLLRRLAAEAVVLEVSITTNRALSTDWDFQNHPYKRFWDSGLMVSVNTDVPQVTNCNLKDEIDQAARLTCASRSDILAAQRQAYSCVMDTRHARRGRTSEEMGPPT